MSDRIKKIKVKKADGSMTDYIPIGVDAENVDFDNGYKLDNIVGSINPDESGSIAAQLSKSIKYYDCVADMKADTTLNGGGAARTLGYYEPGDGGGALYEIIDNNDARYSTSIDNGGSVHDLDNENKALLNIENNTVNVKQFGAYGDDEHDDKVAFSNCFKVNSSCYIIPDGVYRISDRFFIQNKDNIQIFCEGKVHAISSTTSDTQCFVFQQCENVKLDGAYIYSERDKTERPPQGHTRITTLGSNRVGISINNSSNIIINNLFCENLQTDIRTRRWDSDPEYTIINHDIYINNWRSLGSSGPLLIQFTERVWVSNCYLKPAENLGSGDHFFYLDTMARDIHWDNCYCEAPDLELGVGIKFASENPGDNFERAAETGYFSNSYMKCRNFLAFYNTDTTFTIDNCKFESMYIGAATIPAHSYAMTGSQSSNIICKNSEFNTAGLFEGSINTLLIENCLIRTFDKAALIFCQVVTGGPIKNIIFKNNTVYLTNTTFVYFEDTGSEIPNQKMFIENNNIHYISGNYFYSHRGVGTNSYLYVIGNNHYVEKEDGTNLTNAFYNSGTTNTNTWIYNNTWSKVTRLNLSGETEQNNILY